MKNLIILTVFLLIGNTVAAQHFGEDAYKVKQLIEWNYDQKRKRDIVKYGELQYTYEIKYDSLNKIKEITVNQKNVIFYDLEAKSDIVVRYLFNYEEKFTSTVTNYLELTEEHVKQKFDKLYGHRNHGYGYYFTFDYQNARYIYSEENTAIVVYKKFVPSAYESYEFHQLIKEMQRKSKLEKD